MIHCYQCGTDMPDNMLYCTACGKKLDAPETETQVLGQAAAPTVRFAPQPKTQPIAQNARKRGGALKAIVLAVIGVLVAGVIVVVVAVLFVTLSKRSGVTVNSNFNATINRNFSSNAQVNVNSVTPNANAIVDNAMRQIQKAANDALAAANKVSNTRVATGKTLDGRTNRIEFGRGATSATAVGTVSGEARFVLRARAGQTLSARVTSPNACIKFEDGDSTSITSETEAGDNEIIVTNTCGKPTSMVLSVSIK